jgi:hypothetical protein
MSEVSKTTLRELFMVLGLFGIAISHPVRKPCGILAISQEI